MKLLSIFLVTAIGLGVSTRPFSCFPRLVDQPSVKPFEKEMPEAPPHQVPFAGPGAPELTEAQAAAMRNPVKISAESVERGRLYYEYYCRMCHGGDGRTPGPVGESYAPRPADLTSTEVTAMSDGALEYAMVKGAGHDPVLERTAPLDRRWYIANFVRSLATQPAEHHGSAKQPSDQAPFRSESPDPAAPERP